MPQTLRAGWGFAHQPRRPLGVADVDDGGLLLGDGGAWAWSASRFFQDAPGCPTQEAGPALVGLLPHLGRRRRRAVVRGRGRAAGRLVGGGVGIGGAGGDSDRGRHRGRGWCESSRCIGDGGRRTSLSGRARLSGQELRRWALKSRRRAGTGDGTARQESSGPNDRSRHGHDVRFRVRSWQPAIRWTIRCVVRALGIEQNNGGRQSRIGSGLWRRFRQVREPGGWRFRGCRSAGCHAAGTPRRLGCSGAGTP